MDVITVSATAHEQTVTCLDLFMYVRIVSDIPWGSRTAHEQDRNMSRHVIVLIIASNRNRHPLIKGRSLKRQSSVDSLSSCRVYHGIRYALRHTYR